jgi:exonuclease VII small subunit
MAWARARREVARSGVDGTTAEIARFAGEHLLAHERQVSRALALAVPEPPRLLDAAGRDVDDHVAAVLRPAGATLDEVEREVQRTLTLAEALDPASVLAAGYAILRAHAAGLGGAGGRGHLRSRRDARRLRHTKARDPRHRHQGDADSADPHAEEDRTMSDSRVTIGKPSSPIPARFEAAYRELQAISAQLKPAKDRIPDVDEIEPLVKRAKELAAHCQERIECVRRLVDEQQVPI